MKLTIMYLFAYTLCEIIPVYVHNKRNTKSILKLVHIFTRKKFITYAAQLRQPIENSLVLCHLKTLRLYTGPFTFELDHCPCEMIMNNS